MSKHTRVSLTNHRFCSDFSLKDCSLKQRGLVVSPYSIVLYCIMLYSIVFHCIMLYSIVSYCIVLYYIVLYYIISYSNIFYSISLYRLYCILALIKLVYSHDTVCIDSTVLLLIRMGCFYLILVLQVYSIMLTIRTSKQYYLYWPV